MAGFDPSYTNPHIYQNWVFQNLHIERMFEGLRVSDQNTLEKMRKCGRKFQV